MALLRPASAWPSGFSGCEGAWSDPMSALSGMGTRLGEVPLGGVQALFGGRQNPHTGHLSCSQRPPGVLETRRRV